jgi:group I intron endonuclease
MAANRKIPITRINKFYSREDFELDMVVYKTTNLINGKIYIGQDSKNNPNYIGSGKIIKLAIKKYGKNNFIKEILEHCNTKEILDNKEKYWIQKYNSTEKSIGYNITKGGEGCLGLKHSEETKEYMKKINIGKNNPMHGKSLSKKVLKQRSEKVKLLGIHKYENNGNFKYKINGDELRDLFLNKNFKITEIAKHFNCSKDVINNNLRRFEIYKPKSNKYNLDVNQITEYKQNGLNLVQIGEIYGCSNKIIHKYVKNHGK